MTQPTSRSPGSPLGILVCILLFAAFIVLVARGTFTRARPASLISDFTIPTGQVRPPLPYRIVSFHRGRADKNLIKLAAQLGFNGVQFQIEGSNEQGIADFAARDNREHLVDYCHSLGMTVTVWVHELSDLPGKWMPEYLGDPTPENEDLFNYLSGRYEWILGKAVPNVDGLCLTVVETQIRATKSPMLLRLCDLISKKCKEHNKSFMLRTFVWHPEELDGVMGAVRQLPPDTVIMSKAVPQDWQLRGGNAGEVGAVGNRPQIIEFDVEGEYFLHNIGANCMPELLKKQFDYCVSKGAQGVCVRVDRYDDSVLFQPSEVNLWTLGLLASGASNSADDIWTRWAKYHYGNDAAPAVIRAFKPTSNVMAELLSVGPFTFGDTRKLPPTPDEDFLGQNWQNWQWDKSYLPAYHAADEGDAGFIAREEKSKAAAMKLAEQSLADLDTARATLDSTDYQILRTKLITNQAQLAYRTPMTLAALEYHAATHNPEGPARNAHLNKVRQYVQQLHDLVAPRLARPAEVDAHGLRWQIGVPAGIDRNVLLFWCWDTLRLVNGERWPRPKPIERDPDPLHP